MKKLPAAFSCLAAASLAFLFAPQVHAQIETFDTIPDYGSPNIGASSIQGFNNNLALTETFTNVQEITNMTYQFVSTDTSATDAGDSITAYFVQWTPGGGDSSGEAASTTAIFSESFTVPEVGSAGWNSLEYANNEGSYEGYNVTLSINQLTNPANTYAVILVDTSSTNTIGLMSLQNSNFAPDETGNGDAFNFGNDYLKGGVTNGLTSLSSGSSGSQSGDWGFSQLDIVPTGNSLVPLPEPRTAAAILCALFVAVLFGRQLLLRRRESEVGAMALAA